MNFLRLSSANVGRPRDIDLDVIRGLAIVLAMGWHFNKLTGNIIFDTILAPGRIFGWAGVDLFFVLSGFLVGRLILIEYKASGNFDYRRFFLRRVFKLWPVLYVFLAFMCIADRKDIPEFLWQIGLHVQNYIRTPVATHLWSLAVEEHFYLIVTAAMLIFSRKTLHPKHFIIALVGMIILCPIFRAAGAQMGALPVALQQQTHYRLDGLAFGVLLATLSVYYNTIFTSLLRPKWLYAILTILGYVFLSFIKKDSYLGVTLGFTVSYLTGAAMFLALYKSGIENWAKWPSLALAFLGVYSYAMYLFHVPVAKVVEVLLTQAHLKEHISLQIVLSYGGAVIAAYLITKLVEHPSLILREKWFPSRSEFTRG